MAGEPAAEDVVSVFNSDGSPAAQVEPCCAALEEAPFPSSVLQKLCSAGFRAPSPIQRYVWPLANKGWDLIGIAKTGSGKTLAFLLPAFAQILQGGGFRHGCIQLLVLTPTRELAMQIEESAQRFGAASGLRTVCVYGGVPRGPQLSDLRRVKPHIVVACPGRLNDFLSWNQVDLSHVSNWVVDEADRLLDMGFEPQVRDILRHLPPQRQSMLFSATWPESVRALAADLLRLDYLMIRVGASSELRANNDVSQAAFVLPDVVAKEQMLLEQLRNIAGAQDKVLIFCNARDDCDRIYEFLQDSGVQCAATHGLINQIDREQILLDYRNGVERILVATDLAARGLDIEGITVVINFDPPHSYKVEDYVHRIGRTGRAGKRGRAVTLLLPTEKNQAKAIADVMRSTGQAVSSELEELAAQARGSAKDRKAEKRAQYRASLQKRDEDAGVGS